MRLSYNLGRGVCKYFAALADIFPFIGNKCLTWCLSVFFLLPLCCKWYRSTWLARPFYLGESSMSAGWDGHFIRL